MARVSLRVNVSVRIVDTDPAAVQNRAITTLDGTSVPRLHLPQKLTGEFAYAQEVRVPAEGNDHYDA
jgi:hypothetical protein